MYQYHVLIKVFILKPIKVHLKHETFHECFSVKMYVKICVIFGDVTCQGSEDGDKARTFT